MSNEFDKLTESVGKAIETVPTLYEDALKPTATESGKLLSLIPKTINAALTPLRKWIAEREYNIAETEALLAKKLEHVSAEKIVTPDAYVAVPAIQAISYSMDSKVLKNLYANLLARSMNISTKDWVHPAFIEIIKQLSPNDVQVLEKICSDNSFQMINVYVCKYDTKNPRPFDQPIQKYGYEGLTSITSIPPDMVKISIDNLSRLQLIEDRFKIDMSVDEKVKASSFYLDTVSSIKQYMTDQTWKFEEYGHYLTLSIFGSYFHNICIKNP